MKMGQTVDWDDPAEVTKLRTLWADPALSTAEIGRRLGISKSAVCGKAGRLDLPRRDSPIKERKMDKVLNVDVRNRVGGARRDRAKPVLPGLSSDEAIIEEMIEVPVEAAKPKPAVKPVILKPKPIIVAPVFVGRIRECCWPMSNVGRRWTFCDAPTIPGKDYCEPHHTIGFYKPRQRGYVSDQVASDARVHVVRIQERGDTVPGTREAVLRLSGRVAGGTAA